MAFKHISILGLGLIGGSVARSVRACLPNAHITAMDLDAATLEAAQEMGIADAVTHDVADAVRGADLIVLCVPVEALPGVAASIAPHIKPGAAVTDVASVKRIVLRLFPENIAVVPAHPIAGSEKTGIAAGSATLLAGKRVILTPENPEAPMVKPVAEFWRALQMQVHYMPAALHDDIYACISHLPQYLAFNINEIYKMFHVEHSETEALRHFLRLTRSDAGLWRGIFECNKDNINKHLLRYLQVLRQIQNELNEGTEVAPPDEALVYGVLFPRVAASCMVYVAQLAERELQVPLKDYAGAGFADFTAPAMQAPEAHLEAISGQAHAVARALGEFAGLLEVGRRYI